MQQYLPFTVLKRSGKPVTNKSPLILVATVLTVYGIETMIQGLLIVSIKLQQYLPFTVLKPVNCKKLPSSRKVATVLTVYGIETIDHVIPRSFGESCNSTYRLRY